MSPRPARDWEIIQVGTPPPEAVNAFITALVPLVVRTIHTWIDQGKATLVPQPDGSNLVQLTDRIGS